MANYVSTVVAPGSSWQLGAGDTALYTSVYGMYSLSNGAVDSSATVFSGGVETVSSGGTAFDVTVSGGALNVYSAGAAARIDMKQGGWAGIYNGGTAVSASVSSGALFNVYSGGAVSGVEVYSSGRLSVRAGAAARDVRLQAGASAGLFRQNEGTGSVSLFSGTQVYGAGSGLNGFGRLDVAAGGTLSDTVFSSGSMGVSSGGRVSGTQMVGGALAVLSGGTAANTTIRNGAALSVNEGGAAVNVTLRQGGTANLIKQIGAEDASIQKISGGRVTGIVTGLDYEGALHAGSGAALSGTVVNSGVMVLYAGAAANEIGARSGGTVIVSSGAAARSLVISSGAALNFADGATASAVTMKAGGSVWTFEQAGGSDALLEKISGGIVTGSATGLDFTGSLEIGQSGSALGALVEKDGTLRVLANGYASGGSVLAGGTLDAETAARVSGVTIASGGVLAVEEGAQALGLVQQAGGNVNVVVTEDGIAQVTGTNELGAFQLSGGTAQNFVVYSDGRMVVSSGASASGILIRTGGIMSASIAGDVTGSSVDMGMNFSISSGVRSGLNMLSNFVLMVDSGYQINGQVLRGGGVQEVGFHGVVDSTIVSSGGMLDVRSGAQATNAVVLNGGRVKVDVHGVAAETLFSGVYADNGSKTFSLSGGVASGFDLYDGCSMTVHSAGQAVKTRVFSGGELTVSSAGVVSSLVQNDGAAVRAFVFGSDAATVIAGSRTGDDIDFSLSNGTASSFLLENGGMLHVYSAGVASDTDIRSGGSMIVEYGGTAAKTRIDNGGMILAGSSSVISGLTVSSGALANLADGVKLEGVLVLKGNAVIDGEISAETATIDMDIAGYTGFNEAIVSNLGAFNGAMFQVTVAADQARARYLLAGGAAGFASNLTVRDDNGMLLGTFTNTVRTFAAGGEYYHLTDTAKGELILSVSTPNSDLLSNSCSQIVAWDAAQGAVGYIMNAGAPSPAWAGIYNWGDLGQQDMWRVEGVGKFAGSQASQDGILLYNKTNNTFAAWTDLTDPTYGYVSLCHVDDNFSTSGLADFDGNGFDDVIIFNEKGSVGIVSDGAAYHDVWHVDDPASNIWTLKGAGCFDPAKPDSLLFRHTGNGHLYLWDNQDPTFENWKWEQTDIGYLADGWEVLGVGDFRGDGIDDIVLMNTNDNNAVFIWDDGKQASQRYVGILEDGFAIEAVGDYNGDGKEDLLLREYNTGWGGLGYWASGEASGWTDMNARIETGYQSNYAIIA